MSLLPRRAGGQPVPAAFNQHFMSTEPQPACCPEVMRNVNEGLVFSKDSPWPPSISVFTFSSDLDIDGVLHVLAFFF